MYEAPNTRAPSVDDITRELEIIPVESPTPQPQSIVAQTLVDRKVIIQTTGSIFRFDAAGSTDLAREELQRRLKSHADGKSNTSHTRAVSRALGILKIEEHRKALVNWWVDMFGTPAELEGQDIKRGLAASAVLAHAMTATIDILREYEVESKKVFAFGKSGGDAFDIYDIEGGHEETIRTVFKGVCFSLGLTEMSGRIGVAEVTPDNPVMFLTDKDNNIIGSAGQPFAQAELNERENKEITRVKEWDTTDDQETPGKVENSAKRTELTLHTDIAFGAFEVDPDPENLKLDEEIASAALPTEFKIQLQLEKVLSKHEYRLGKVGHILFDEKTGRYKAYFIPMRVSDTASPNEHFIAMRNFVDESQAIGINIKLAITNDSIQVFYDKDGNQIDIGGHIANYLARQVYSEIEEDKERGEASLIPGLVCDARFIRLIGEDGFKLQSFVVKESRLLKGIGMRGLYDILKGTLTDYQDKLVIERSKTFGSLMDYVNTMFRRELPGLIYYLSKDILLENLIIYSGIENIENVTEEQLKRFKILLLSLVTGLRNTEPGTLISRISDTALKHRFYKEKLQKLLELDDSKARDVLEYESSLIFGRNFPCRELSVLAVYHEAKEINDRLIAAGLLRRFEEDGIVYLLPDPILSSYLYASLGEEQKDINHALIASYLYSESEGAWDNIDSMSKYKRVRAFLLHFVYDGKNLTSRVLSKYVKTALNGLKFMVTHRLYGDYCAVANSLIKHIESISPKVDPEQENTLTEEEIAEQSKRKMEVREYKLMLVYAHMRNSNAKAAIDAHSTIGDDHDENFKRRMKRALTTIGFIIAPPLSKEEQENQTTTTESEDDINAKVEMILELTSAEDPDFYHIMEYIEERFGVESHHLILDMILKSKFPLIAASYESSSMEQKKHRILDAITTKEDNQITSEDLDTISVVMRLAWHLSRLIDYSVDPTILRALALLEGEKATEYQKILAKVFKKVLENGHTKDNESVLTHSVIRMLVASGDNSLLEMVVSKEEKAKQEELKRFRKVAKKVI